MRKLCIVCGRPIRKKTTTFYFKPPQEAHEARRVGVGFSSYHELAQQEKPDGHREKEYEWSWTIYTSRIPKTKSEAQSFVNMPIVGVRRGVGDTISNISVWDGESYEDEFFDTGECAKRQGYASARHGERYTWK